MKIGRGLLVIGMILLGQWWPVPTAAQPAPPESSTSAQQGATGLSTGNNADLKTAGLGFVVQRRNWPFLYARGGAGDLGDWAHPQSLTGPIGIELGQIEIPSTSATYVGESMDWAHHEMTFTSAVGQLHIVTSRLSPAVLVDSTANSLRLLSGPVTGYSLNNGSLNYRQAAPAYPKYVAYSTSGNIQGMALSNSTTALTGLDQNWILIWYGTNSHFVDTRRPLTYPGVPWSSAFQADVPVLVVFEHLPTSIRQSTVGGVELAFAGGAGRLAVMPLYGRFIQRAADTQAWASAVPSIVAQKARWWSQRLCDFPMTAGETYEYNSATDTVLIHETFQFQTFCGGGIRFAPVPPMLAVAADKLGVTFSGVVSDPAYATDFGPYRGIENSNGYTWSISGLDKYVRARRSTSDGNPVPPELVEELTVQVERLVNAGHLAPWVFMDSVPRNDLRGDIYWLNPADVVYQLTEIADALSGTTRQQLINYLRAERNTFPPETIPNLPLNQGGRRASFAIVDAQELARWTANRPDLFLKRIPTYNFYSLMRYYDLLGEAPPASLLGSATTAFDADLREQDWATLHWFKGFGETRVAVVNANRYFAGLLGYVRLAARAGNSAAEVTGRALLAKAAVLRVGMAEYPRFLYSAGLIVLPSDPAWQPKYTAGDWSGFVYNYNWTGPDDDVRQVVQLDQFGTVLGDSTAFWSDGPWIGDDWRIGICSGHLVAFQNLVPELGLVLSDTLGSRADSYATAVRTIFPTWYGAFSEAVLGEEHNLSHPGDSYQVFMASALMSHLTPDQLAKYIDIPWIQTGDLFYMQKLAETIRTYRGDSWNSAPSLSLTHSVSRQAAKTSDVITITIAVGAPAGSFTSTIPITVTSAIPAGLAYVNGTCESLTFSALTCSNLGVTWKDTLVNGDSPHILTFSMQVTTSVRYAVSSTVVLDAGFDGTQSSSKIIVLNPYETYLSVFLKGSP